MFNGGAEWPAVTVQAAADDTVAFIEANADRAELYHLGGNRGEGRNETAEHPDVVASLSEIVLELK